MFFPEEMILAHWGKKVAKKCNQCDHLFLEVGNLRMHLMKNTVKKVKQLQPVSLCIFSTRQFEDTFDNIQGGAHINVTSDYVFSCAGDFSDTFKTYSGEQSHKCSLKFTS